jgi:hypothetical protein
MSLGTSHSVREADCLGFEQGTRSVHGHALTTEAVTTLLIDQ